MRAVIVEDNEIDRLNMVTLLESETDVELVGMANTLDQAVALIDKEEPDAVFLDIHLGRQRGFNVLHKINHNPLVVITTSHPHYAVRGFEIDAVDYLLKPIEKDTLGRSLQRLRRRLETAAEETDRGRLSLESVLMFRKAEATHFVTVKQLQAITGERVYTRVLVEGGHEFLHNRPLREWREILPEQFKALDRSTIINLPEVVKVVKGVKRGTGAAVLRGRENKIELGSVAMIALAEAVR